MPTRSTTHTGGQLAFGPDGDLYIGVGDGGGQGDPDGYGQNMSTLLAKTSASTRATPTAAARRTTPSRTTTPSSAWTDAMKIWVYGHAPAVAFLVRPCDRRPLDRGRRMRTSARRSTADRANGSGVNAGKGKNLGWSQMRRQHRRSSLSPGMTARSGKLPLYEYGHAAGWCSVTGGFVYRGPMQPDGKASTSRATGAAVSSSSTKRAACGCARSTPRPHHVLRGGRRQAPVRGGRWQGLPGEAERRLAPDRLLDRQSSLRGA